jgi:hypothetical protein
MLKGVTSPLNQSQLEDGKFQKKLTKLPKTKQLKPIKIEQHHFVLPDNHSSRYNNNVAAAEISTSNPFSKIRQQMPPSFV